MLVRFRANGYSLFARRSGEPLARLRLTGNGDQVVLLYPSHRGGWGALGDFGASAMSLDKALQCLSEIHISWTCARPTVEPLQRIDAKQECRSLETTVLLPYLDFINAVVPKHAAPGTRCHRHRRNASSFQTGLPG